MTFATLETLIDRSGRGEQGFWDTVHDTMSEALIVVTPDRRIVYGNESARKILNITLEEARGRPCLESMECPQCGCACKLFENGGVHDLEVVLYTPERRVFRKNARLLKDADGQVLGGVETFVDVTEEQSERVELERRAELLHTERKRSDALLKEVSEGVFALDPELRIKDYSPAMHTLTGFTPEEANGQPFFELLGLPAPDVTELEALADRSQDAVVTRKSGRPQSVQLRFLPLRFGSEDVMGLMRPAAPQAPEVERLEREYGFAGMLSRASVMRDLFRLLESVADTEANIMIQGESGTGKELVARAIHSLSGRRTHPFYAVNCATFTGSLLLSELFGHERGAFTGAYKTQRGKLELAERGTLLLDEVSEIPLQHQALLLRVLESRRFERVGGTESIPLHARVVAAANQDLMQAVEQGRLRSDLFFRLNVIPVRIPPLRERPEDIEILLRYFLWKANTRGKPAHPIPPAVLDALTAYPWPGNVRELKNVAEYLCFICEDGIRLKDLPAHILHRGAAPSSAPLPACTPSAPTPAAELDERARILAALETHHYKKAKAATTLGMDRTTLWRKMRRLGIDDR
ncbi:MAG: sigma 54-interacting transcriptional regulator [Myxococcales bacterium]|nr:sigma 54-interacting transcriptional regulator [Myxococcales bacterium]